MTKMIEMMTWPSGRGSSTFPMLIPKTEGHQCPACGSDHSDYGHRFIIWPADPDDIQSCKQTCGQRGPDRPDEDATHRFSPEECSNAIVHVGSASAARKS